MKYLNIFFEDDSIISIEAFGPETIMGAVSDVLNGNYKPQDEKNAVVKLEISNKSPFR